MSPRQLLLCSLALAACIWVLNFWDLGAVPLYTVGEPREAVQVVESFDHGEWILPRRNGTELPSKPPLFHWLGGLTAVSAGRVDEWVVRLPSALIAATTLLAVLWFGARRWDAAAGFYAAFVLTTNFEWLRAARMARVDMTLTGCLTAAFLSLAVVVEAPAPPLGALAVLYVAMGLATLAKGPVGIALPVLTGLAYLALRHDLGRLRQMHVGRGLAVAVSIPAAWYLLAITEGGMAFVRKQLLRENIVHFLGPGERGASESHHVWYYAQTLLGGFAPWGFFLVPLAIFLWQNRRRADLIRPYHYPLVWFAVVIGFYSLSASKRSNYILSAYPAAALMIGAWWRALARDGAALPPRLRRIVQGVVTLLAGATAILLVLVLAHAIGLDPLEWIRPLLHGKDQQNLPLVRDVFHSYPGTVAAWALSTGLAGWLLIDGSRRARWPQVFTAMVLYVAATAAAIDHTFFPRLGRDRSYQPFIADVVHVVGDSDRLFFFDTFDYGAIFYARRHIPEARARLPEAPAWLILTDQAYAHLAAADRARAAILLRSDGSGPEGRAPYLLVRLDPPAENNSPPAQ
jgi:4-amino-4-deoxy-L-arabinose transferase-like glycosyltransferase